MGSTADKPFLGPLKFALFTLIFIASVSAAVHCVSPLVRERHAAIKKLYTLKDENADLEQQIAQIRKNKTEFQNNNVDFIMLTGYREEMLGVNEKVFEFSEPANKK